MKNLEVCLRKRSKQDQYGCERFKNYLEYEKQKLVEYYQNFKTWQNKIALQLKSDSCFTNKKVA